MLIRHGLDVRHRGPQVRYSNPLSYELHILRRNLEFSELTEEARERIVARIAEIEAWFDA